MLWRNQELRHVYDLCKPFQLPLGLLISHDFDKPVKYIRQAIYHQNCYRGHTPMLDVNSNLVLNAPVQPLPMVMHLWHEFTRSSVGGSFVYSVVPIVYSIAISAVITLFLTIFVITNYSIKPSLLLKSSTVLSSAYMLILVVKSIVVLHNQQKDGFLHGEDLLHRVNTSIYLSIIDLIVVLLLQVLQVQVVMRLFLRQSDKRITFFVGLGAAITSQTLWGITRFHNFSHDAEAGKIIPALTYLVRIAMGMFYAAIFTAFLLIKIRHIAANRNIWLISFLTFVFIYAPVAFFIADISNAWVYGLSEIFSVVTYVVCVVMPWEWCNKYNIIQRVMEKEGVLGRRFYEDELYELDRFELFVEDERSDAFLQSSNGSRASQATLTTRRTQRTPALGSGLGLLTNTTKFSSPSMHSLSEQKRKEEEESQSLLHPRFTMERLTNGLILWKDRFFDVTDRIIATGLDIPRSVSTGSPLHLPPDRRPSDVAPFLRHPSRNVGPSRSRTSNSRAVSFSETDTRHRRDVYLYSTRDVVLDLDTELLASNRDRPEV